MSCDNENNKTMPSLGARGVTSIDAINAAGLPQLVNARRMAAWNAFSFLAQRLFYSL